MPCVPPKFPSHTSASLVHTCLRLRQLRRCSDASDALGTALQHGCSSSAAASAAGCSAAAAVAAAAPIAPRPRFEVGQQLSACGAGGAAAVPSAPTTVSRFFAASEVPRSIPCAAQRSTRKRRMMARRSAVVWYGIVVGATGGGTAVRSWLRLGLRSHYAGGPAAVAAQQPQRASLCF
eukprot:357845-Chlamydomonas_euryale.AAC.7